MTWFHHKIISVALYSVPTILVQCILHRLFSQRKESPLSLALQVQARINGTCLSWSIMLIGLTIKGSRSGYIIMIPLLLVTICNFINGIMGIQNSSRSKILKFGNSDKNNICLILIVKKWLYVHLVGQMFVIIWSTYVYHLFLNLLIPIAGRSGYEKNPELLIGLLTGILTIFITSFMVCSNFFIFILFNYTFFFLSFSRHHWLVY